MAEIIMNKLAVKEKINILEAEIRLLKNAVTSRPDFDVDEDNWKRLKPDSKKIRAKLFKSRYA